MKGAPIRFVVVVVGGWTCVRIAVLLPGVPPMAFAGDVLASPARASGQVAERREPAAVRRVVAAPPLTTRSSRMPVFLRRDRSRAVVVVADQSVRGSFPTDGAPTQEPAPAVLVPAMVGAVSIAASARRWSASTWLLARGGAGGTLSGGQLGASQVGARALYGLNTAHRVSLAGRIAAPLRGRGAEAAIGLDWQPTAAAPVHLVTEQRFGLDGARGGPTAMAIGGLNPTQIGAGFRLEAYAQAGGILRDGRVEAFGDGALRLARPVARVGRVTLDLGAGAWAAGQRGAARVDVGPTVGVMVPVTGRSVRVSLDWRQRVAGDARPGSGPALSIGSDF